MLWDIGRLVSSVPVGRLFLSLFIATLQPDEKNMSLYKLIKCDSLARADKLLLSFLHSEDTHSLKFQISLIIQT